MSDDDMFDEMDASEADTERRQMDASNRRMEKLQKSIPNPLPKNPVFTVIREALILNLHRKHCSRIVLARCELHDTAVREWIGDDALAAISRMVLDAMTSGKVGFGKVVEDAIKAAPALFLDEVNADRFSKFVDYVCSLGVTQKPLPPLGEIRSGFDNLPGSGAPLSGKQWAQFRDAAGLTGVKRGKSGPKNGGK